MVVAPRMPSSEKKFATGLLAETGEYAYQKSLDELYLDIVEELNNQSDYEKRYIRDAPKRDYLTEPSENHEDLTWARWGFIVPKPPYNDLEVEHIAAVKKLAAHREKQAKSLFYCELPDKWSYYDFCDHYELVAGQIETGKIPYYLCIVGSPERIPWEFQQYLDSDYAVGRLWFDESGDVQHYVDALISYESSQSGPRNGKWALFASVIHHGDVASENFTEYLTKPLARYLQDMKPQLGFSQRFLLGQTLGEEATKQNFIQYFQNSLSQGNPPSIFFTSSHGYETETFGTNQEMLQGSPLFQDYPWPLFPIEMRHCLSGDEVQQENLIMRGCLGISYACFSAGTPLKSDWVEPTIWGNGKKIANRNFVARLPQKLLALGMLGFIGHVSRTGRYAYQRYTDQSTKFAGSHIEPYKWLLRQAASGGRVGHSLRYLNRQWGALTQKLDFLKDKKSKKDETLDTYWARNDYRGFVFLGDPASRLRVNKLQT